MNRSLISVHQTPTYTDRQAMQAATLHGLYVSTSDGSIVLPYEIDVQLTGGRGTLVPCLQVDWDAVFGPSLYSRKRGDTGAYEEIGVHQGDIFALQLLAAMNPATCPVPYLQRQAWLFCDHLFGGNGSSSLPNGERRDLLADEVRQFTMLRRRFAAYWHSNTRGAEWRSSLVKEFNRVLSPVKLSDYRLRSSGYKLPELHTLLVSHDIKKCVSADRPAGLHGRYRFTDVNELSAIFSCERLGAHKVGSMLILYLRPYVNDVLDSGNYVPWMPDEQTRERGLLCPDDLFDDAIRWLRSHLTVQPPERAREGWELAKLPNVPLSEKELIFGYEARYEIQDTKILRPVDQAVESVQVVKSVSAEEAAEADRILLTTGHAPTRTGEHTMFAVAIPEPVLVWMTDSHLRFIWTATGAYVNPTIMRGETLETLEAKYIASIQAIEEPMKEGIRFNLSREAKRMYNARTEKVDGAYWVHVEVVLVALPDLPEVVKEFFREKFARTRAEMLAEIRKPQPVADGEALKRVRNKLPFTLDEDRVLWETYRPYSKDLYWDKVHHKMPHHAIGRVRRRGALLALCRQHGLTLEECRKPANIRNKIAHLPDYFNTVM